MAAPAPPPDRDPRLGDAVRPPRRPSGGDGVGRWLAGLLVALAAIGTAVVVIAPRTLGGSGPTAQQTAAPSGSAPPAAGTPAATDALRTPSPATSPTAGPSSSPTPSPTAAPRRSPAPSPSARPTPRPTIQPPGPLDGGRWDTGFEGGSSGGWTAGYNPKGATITTAVYCGSSAPVPAHGGSCLFEAGTTATPSSVVQPLAHTTTAGQSYRVTLWIRCRVAATALVIVALESRTGPAGPANPGVNSGVLTIGAAWQQVTLTLTVAAAGSLGTEVYFNPGAGVDVDDVSYLGPF
ncbi:MAG TPA: hypothetical protein VFO60_03540 [Candidatus Dormibacteraeota bacterium]|nr:hypothetical protein [Candidatus Dormibacteraeota bacterium]